MARDRELHVVGAGPGGLAAAIHAARRGSRVVVHESGADVGGRFHDDFQGLENWTSPGDVLEELAALGIEADFDHHPVRRQRCFDARGREFEFRSEVPFFYMVRRGPFPGSLDTALKQQALAHGVEIRFGDRVDHLPQGGVVARGPRRSDVIAVGYVFETDADDGAYGVLDDRLAPRGYGYLLIHGGHATLATCMFADFHRERECLERTAEFFRERLGFSMERPRRFGGLGCYALPRSGRHGRLLLAGEAAGFQDAFWGFGMRYAMRSGVFAARSILEEGAGDYDRLWQPDLRSLLETGVVNRYLYTKAGNAGYRVFLGMLARSRDPRAWLRDWYGGSAWKRMLLPLARRALSAAAESECVREDCDCTWCRGSREVAGEGSRNPGEHP